MAAQTRLTSKGQVTIPVAVRRELGLKPGDAVTFEPTAAGFRLRKSVSADQQAMDMAEWDAWLDRVAGSMDMAGKSSDEWLDEIRPHRRDPI